MNLDELAELMEEQPGGHNHGRKRTSGGWWGLEEDLSKSYQGGLTIEEFASIRRRSIKPKNTIRHGTLAAYQNDRCRCDQCRKAQRDYMREWRRRASDMLPEDEL